LGARFPDEMFLTGSVLAAEMNGLDADDAILLKFNLEGH